MSPFFKQKIGDLYILRILINRLVVQESDSDRERKGTDPFVESGGLRDLVLSSGGE